MFRKQGFAMDARIEMSQYVSDDNGRAVSFTSASLHIHGDTPEDPSGDCFDPETCCDERERLLIEELRQYLRPQSAPACLIDRLRHMFDQLDEAPVEKGDAARQA